MTPRTWSRAARRAGGSQVPGWVQASCLARGHVSPGPYVVRVALGTHSCRSGPQGETGHVQLQLGDGDTDLGSPQGGALKARSPGVRKAASGAPAGGWRGTPGKESERAQPVMGDQGRRRSGRRVMKGTGELEAAGRDLGQARLDPDLTRGPGEGSTSGLLGALLVVGELGESDREQGDTRRFWPVRNERVPCWVVCRRQTRGPENWLCSRPHHGEPMVPHVTHSPVSARAGVSVQTCSFWKGPSAPTMNCTPRPWFPGAQEQTDGCHRTTLTATVSLGPGSPTC